MKKYEFWLFSCCLLAWIQMLFGHPLWAIFSMLFLIFVGLLSIVNILLGE